MWMIPQGLNTSAGPALTGRKTYKPWESMLNCFGFYTNPRGIGLSSGSRYIPHMRRFHRSRADGEGGGFGKAGRGKPGDGKSGDSRRGDFRGLDRRGPKDVFSGGFRRGGPGGRSRPQMYDAVCSKCKQRCEVPFKPLPNKPVYCSACFRKDDADKRPANLSDELDRINYKLDRIMRSLHLD